MIGLNIRRCRQDKGMTRQELGMRVGTSWEMVVCWETGRRLPSLKNLDRLAQVLDMEPLPRESSVGKIVGINLKKLREKKCWTTAQLARAAGLRYVTVSLYEDDFTGKQPSLFVIEKLALVLDCWLTDIVGHKPHALGVGDHIYRRRIKQQMSREELGEAIGLPEGERYVIENYEEGITEVPLSQLAKIAEVFELPVDALRKKDRFVKGSYIDEAFCTLSEKHKGLVMKYIEELGLEGERGDAQVMEPLLVKGLF